MEDVVSASEIFICICDYSADINSPGLGICTCHEIARRKTQCFALPVGHELLLRKFKAINSISSTHTSNSR